MRLSSVCIPSACAPAYVGPCMCGCGVCLSRPQNILCICGSLRHLSLALFLSSSPPVFCLCVCVCSLLARPSPHPLQPLSCAFIIMWNAPSSPWLSLCPHPTPPHAKLPCSPGSRPAYTRGAQERAGMVPPPLRCLRIYLEVGGRENRGTQSSTRHVKSRQCNGGVASTTVVLCRDLHAQVKP